MRRVKQDLYDRTYDDLVERNTPRAYDYDPLYRGKGEGLGKIGGTLGAVPFLGALTGAISAGEKVRDQNRFIRELRKMHPDADISKSDAMDRYKELGGSTLGGMDIALPVMNLVGSLAGSGAFSGGESIGVGGLTSTPGGGVLAPGNVVDISTGLPSAAGGSPVSSKTGTDTLKSVAKLGGGLGDSGGSMPQNEPLAGIQPMPPPPPIQQSEAPAMNLFEPLGAPVQDSLQFEEDLSDILGGGGLGFDEFYPEEEEEEEEESGYLTRYNSLGRPGSRYKKRIPRKREFV